MKIQKIIVSMLLVVPALLSAQEKPVSLHDDLVQLFDQALALAANASECARVSQCRQNLLEKKKIEPKELIASLEEVYTITQKSVSETLQELSNKILGWLEALIKELSQDQSFADEVATFDFQEQADGADEYEDDEVTRGKKKNKTFKNLCVQRNVKIGGNLCVAGQALFKNGVAFATTGNLNITAPLAVTTVTGELASFSSVNVSRVYGLNGTSSIVGLKQVFYDPTTGIVYYQL